MQLVDRVKLPCGGGDAPALFRWLTAQAIRVYQASELKNNFFLLHGVTSAWALSRIVLKILPGEEEVLECVRAHLFGLLATYVVEGRPSLLKERLEDTGDIPNMEEIR